MKYSKLKHDIEILELNQKHEIELLKMQHTQARNELIIQCKHTYEDGTSAKNSRGNQWDMFYNCSICGKTL